MSLKERAKEAGKEISIDDLKKNNGVEEIIRILDEIFQSDETARAYHAFKEHVEYRWKIGGQNFSSFVVEYGKRYREVKHC